MSGNAMLTIVASTNAMKTPIDATRRTVRGEGARLAARGRSGGTAGGRGAGRRDRSGGGMPAWKPYTSARGVMDLTLPWGDCDDLANAWGHAGRGSRARQPWTF